jgi:hypothetical protein
MAKPGKWYTLDVYVERENSNEAEDWAPWTHEVAEAIDEAMAGRDLDTGWEVSIVIPMVE